MFDAAPDARLAVPRTRGDEPAFMQAIAALGGRPFPARAGMNRVETSRTRATSPFPARAGMNRAVGPT